MAIRVKMGNKAIHVSEKSGDLYLRFNQLKPNHYEKKHLLSNVFYTICKSFVKQNFQLFFVTFDNSLYVKQKKSLVFSKPFGLFVIFPF